MFNDESVIVILLPLESHETYPAGTVDSVKSNCNALNPPVVPFK